MARILHVEDSRDRAEMVRELLEEEGHDVTNAYTIAGARAALANEKFDLIILDHELDSEITGAVFAKELANKGSTTPVIMFTSYEWEIVKKAGNLDQSVPETGKPVWAHIHTEPTSASALNIFTQLADTVARFTSRGQSEGEVLGR